MAEAIDTLADRVREQQDDAVIKATGAVWGHVATIIPRFETDASRRKFQYLVAALSGVVAGLGYAIIESIRAVTNSQVLLVHRATMVTETGTPTSLLLHGYCTQASRDAPESAEEYRFVPPDKIDAQFASNLATLARLAEQRGGELADEYAFIDDADLFSRRFAQAAVWIITDDIDYLKVKDQVFGSFRSRYMFFLPSCYEVLLQLRSSIVHAGFPADTRRFYKQMLEVIALNKKLGLIADDKTTEWARRFKLGKLS